MPKLRQHVRPHNEALVTTPPSPPTTHPLTHTHRQWFTFCFLPLIPFSLKPYKEVGCHICHFYQDIKYRPDVQQQMGLSGGHAEQGVMMHGGAGGPPGQGGQGYGPPPAGVPQQYK
jgi:hypothetical protein